MMLPTVAVTAGEPAGIGPDLCVALAAEPVAGARVVVIADPQLLRARAQRLGVPVALRGFDPGAAPARRGELLVDALPLAVGAEPGRVDPRNAHYVLESIGRAVAGCRSGRYDALATAPVHKGVINDAGIAFTGHTERLAELTGTPRVVMMLVGGGLRVALASTHLPLAEVPRTITRPGLEATLRILLADLERRFGIRHPRVLVAGLNPHAGEGGYLGREEIDVIEPVLRRLAAEGHAVSGPIPADTLFHRERLAAADAVLAMYHDQGLPVLKYASFGAGVNVTLGLPIIRTSVDHGTALDRAGTGGADAGSLRSAIALAAELARGVPATRPAAPHAVRA
jgi:4-hydroxythreonine-4-phosphate dehydrogenase